MLAPEFRVVCMYVRFRWEKKKKGREDGRLFLECDEWFFLGGD